MSEQEHVEWCRTTFALLADGGVWGVPRSGLVFQKREGMLVLTEEMPLMPGMPLTEAELREQQAAEFETIKRHFEAAGITVTRAD